MKKIRYAVHYFLLSPKRGVTIELLDEDNNYIRTALIVPENATPASREQTNKELEVACKALNEMIHKEE